MNSKAASSTENLMWNIINLVLAIVFVIFPLLFLIQPISKADFFERKLYLKTYKVASEMFFSYDSIKEIVLPKKGKSVLFDFSSGRVSIDKLETDIDTQNFQLLINFTNHNKILLSKNFFVFSTERLPVSSVKLCIDMTAFEREVLYKEIYQRLRSINGIYFDSSCEIQLKFEKRSTKNEILYNSSNEIHKKIVDLFEDTSYEKKGSSETEKIIFLVENINQIFEIVKKIYLQIQRYSFAIVINSNPILHYSFGKQVILDYSTNRPCDDENWRVYLGNTLLEKNSGIGPNHTFTCCDIPSYASSYFLPLRVEFFAKCYFFSEGGEIVSKNVNKSLVLFSADSLIEKTELFSLLSNREIKRFTERGIVKEIRDEVVKDLDVTMKEDTIKLSGILDLKIDKFLIDTSETMKQFISYLSKKEIKFTISIGKEPSVSLKSSRSLMCEDYCDDVAEAIVKYGIKGNVDPLLILALFLVESNVNKNVGESCVGLGQICSKYHKYMILSVCNEIVKEDYSLDCSESKINNLLQDVRINTFTTVKILKSFYDQGKITRSKGPLICSIKYGGITYKAIDTREYLGWAAALRRYNGLGCSQNLPEFIYPDQVIAVYNELIKEYEEFNKK
ncbi:MAG: hypothetical protein QW524_03025 [Candidatus Woesearchaeota archaeon]